MSSASQQMKYWQQMQQASQQQVQTGIGQGLSSLSQHHAQILAKMLEIEQSRTQIDPKKLEALKNTEPRKVLMKAPDGVIPITAWRGWGLSNMKLCALGSSGVWEPKKAMEAVCNKGAQHRAPDRDCNCGMWSFKTLDGLVSALKPYSVLILGQVSLWGRIIETENGFRAQYAYPKELWLLDNSLEELGYIYGVPVRTS